MRARWLRLIACWRGFDLLAGMVADMVAVPAIPYYLNE